jgi:Leucine-rich repeat (LRR) protein
MSNNTLELLTGIETLGHGTSNNKSFYFDTNHIQSISPQIGYVKNLFRLNFNNNELKTLPSDIFNIPTLQELCVKNNANLNDDDLKKVNIKYKNSCNRKRKFSNKKIQ